VPGLNRKFAASLNGTIADSDENLQLFAGLTNGPLNVIRISWELVYIMNDSTLVKKQVSERGNQSSSAEMTVRPL
jgi:hypothetical protein